MFFGILIYMGIVKKPSCKEYWSKSILFGNPGFRELMTIDHFEQIRSYLHFVDEKESNKKDPFYKIRPMVDHIISSSQKLFSPEQCLTIDESMIRFNGRSGHKVYMPLKPIRYGFKAYVLTESSSGYVLNWMLHQRGKKQTLQKTIELLTNNLKNKGHQISMDRFYTTLDVVNYLTEIGFRVIGAVMQNRARLPENIIRKSKELERGEALFYCSNDNNLLLTIWRDSKLLHLVSNIGNNQMIETQRYCKIKKQDKVAYENITLTYPKNVQIYSQNSRGVDHLDQMISYYSPDLRSKKWYTQILLHLIEIAIHNSFILYTMTKNQKLTYLEFRKSIIKSLLLGMRIKKKFYLHLRKQRFKKQK